MKTNSLLNKNKWSWLQNRLINGNQITYEYVVDTGFGIGVQKTRQVTLE